MIPTEETREPKFFAAFGKTDYFKNRSNPEKKLGFWDFFDRAGIKPYGYLFSIAYKYSVFPEVTIPVIGDCGARKYRFDQTPVIRGQEVSAEWAAKEYLKYCRPEQEKYLVAPDHIVMEGLSKKEKEERQEFNFTNAATFLKLTENWPNTIAIATAHGLTVAERIQSAKELIEIGYKAIGLGGLVGIGSVKYTLLIVKEIAEQLPAEIHTHVFGLCAPAYGQEFKKLGIKSFDGSTHIQEGFKGRLLEAIEGRLKRHQCSSRPSEKITIPQCNCNPCWLLKKIGLEPRLSNNRENNLARVTHNLGALALSQRQAGKRKIVLIACVAKKLDRASEAKDLYCSQWFKAAYKYARTTGGEGQEMYFLSAQHGLVKPNQILEPYECDPRKRNRQETLSWQAMIVNQLKELAPEGAQFKIIAGRKYYDGVKEPLEKSGLYTVSTPLQGLGIGLQLKWLKLETPKYKQLSLLEENFA